MPQTGVSAAGGVLQPAGPRPLLTRDFDQVAHLVRRWDLALRQLGRGPFRGELGAARAGGVQVVRIAVNRVVQARGGFRPDTYGFSLVTPANQAATWRGQHLTAGQINVNRPGEAVDHLSSADYEILTLMVDAAALRKTAAVLHGIDLDDRLAGVTAVHADPGAFAALEAFARRLLRGAGRPEAEHTGHRLLIDALLSAAPVRDAGGGGTGRDRLVRSAEDFMMAHLDRPLMAANLCAALDVSERTLRYAFRDRFGLSPMAYFKAQKLNAVRHALKAAAPGRLTVHGAARRWGFDHTGHLAADYRRLFGELPSQTLTAR